MELDVPFFYSSSSSLSSSSFGERFTTTIRLPSFVIIATIGTLKNTSQAYAQSPKNVPKIINIITLKNGIYATGCLKRSCMNIRAIGNVNKIIHDQCHTSSNTKLTIRYIITITSPEISEGRTLVFHSDDPNSNVIPFNNIAIPSTPKYGVQATFL